MDQHIAEALATLRVGMPQKALAEIVGAKNMPKREADKGHYRFSVYEDGAVGPRYPFMARITTDGRIGALQYFASFASSIEIDGLAIGMSREQALRALPQAEPSAEHSSDKYGHEGFIAPMGVDARTILIFRDGRLLSLSCELTDSVWPHAMHPEAQKVRQGLKAYDIELRHGPIDQGANQGWVFGLPPGIRTEQWPLDPISGFPLMHGFTLLLPEDYRVHGPGIVALSFFATASDQNDGGARIRDDLYAAVTGASAPAAEGADLRPFREHAAHSPPRLHRMRDILDYEYAVLLLTRDEFEGALCQPPKFPANAFLNESTRPRWMLEGSGHTCYWSMGGYGSDGQPAVDNYIHKVLGSVPEKRLDWHRAIFWTPRANDPNAGIPPEEVFDGSSSLGYNSPYDPENNFAQRPWATDHKSNHIGGTMRPTQGTPEFSPFYIEFEEYFGGYNFGAGGNAQLDILQLRFDWACG